MSSKSVGVVKDLVLLPVEGLLAGLVGSVLMLVSVALLQPASDLEAGYLLRQIGSVLFTTADSHSTLALSAGLAVHLIVSLLLGLLYAASQQQIPIRGLVAVGTFYGLVNWIIGSLLVGSLLSQTLRETLRSWPWFAACIVYGLSLASVAIWVKKRQSDGANVVVKH